MRVSKFSGLLFALWIASVEPHAQVFADTTSAPPRHVLAGHSFLPSNVLPLPFAQSLATVSFGIAGGSYPIGSLVTTTSPNLKLLSVEPSVNVQVGFLSRFALSASANGVLISGINAYSAFRYGASTGVNWNIGALGEIVQQDDLVLSLAFNYTRVQAISIVPASILPARIKHIIEPLGLYSANDEYTDVYLPDLRFAYTFSPTIGLLAGAGVRIVNFSLDSGGGAAAALPLGAGLNVNLKSMNIPLGITANYLRDQSLGEGMLNRDLFSIGLFETYNDWRNLGIEMGMIAVSGQITWSGYAIGRAYF